MTTFFFRTLWSWIENSFFRLLHKDLFIYDNKSIYFSSLKMMAANQLFILKNFRLSFIFHVCDLSLIFIILTKKTIVIYILWSCLSPQIKQYQILKGLFEHPRFEYFEQGGCSPTAVDEEDIEKETGFLQKVKSLNCSRLGKSHVFRLIDFRAMRTLVRTQWLQQPVKLWNVH